jgi:ribosome-associated translation inhibitor RaiA
MKNDTYAADYDLYTEAENRIHKLAEGHTDIIGASVNLTKPSAGTESPYLCQATVVLYVRPENIAAIEKQENPLLALKGALEAVERQVREKREKLRNY